MATLSAQNMILVANPSVPANDLPGLLALARAEPGKLNFSSAGSGIRPPGGRADEHDGQRKTFLRALQGRWAGDHGPDRRPGAILRQPDHRASIRDGKLKALAVTSPTRMAVLPQVPTISEAGLKGYEMRVWYAVLALAEAPKDIAGQAGDRNHPHHGLARSQAKGSMEPAWSSTSSLRIIRSGDAGGHGQVRPHHQVRQREARLTWQLLR